MGGCSVLHVTLAFLCKVCAGAVYKVRASCLKIRITRPLWVIFKRVCSGGMREFCHGMRRYTSHLVWCHFVKSLLKFGWIGFTFGGRLPYLTCHCGLTLTPIHHWVSLSTVHDGIRCWLFWCTPFFGNALWDPLSGLYSECRYSRRIWTALQNGVVPL